MLITDTLSPQAFEEALRAKGAFYHIHHPYHIAMHNGDATREQIQGWVANRFYYQTTIQLKDAAIMANCPDAQTRRKWVQRILDHDGSHGEDGGIEAWLRLGEAVGLSRDDLLKRVWGYQHAGDGRIVDNLVYRLRSKIERDPADPEHLVTVRGFGYRLKA